MKKGSITIFATLSMVLVAAVLFSLLEVVRFQEIKRVSQLQTEVSLESFFANYDLDLWEEYHLLGSEDRAMLTQLSESGNARNMAREYGLNLFQAQIKDIEVESVTRITDGGGSVFVSAVSSYMEDQMLYETIKNLYNQYDAIRSLIQSGEFNRSSIDEALRNIQEMQSKIPIEKNQTDHVSIGEAKDINEDLSLKAENPLEVVNRVQKMGILELLISDNSMISDREIGGDNLVSKRQLREGVYNQIPESEWLDKVYFQQYLLSQFSNFRNVSEKACLLYELEYILSGNSKDVENLKAVVQQLLGIREVANFLYLMSDVMAQEEAGVLAVALVGASVNPIVIETVKIGILTAWAFGESILDVRALLSGKRVPLLKSRDTWTLALTDFTRIIQTDFMSKESAAGINYETYLGILLLFQQENISAMHAMDLQEINIRKKEKNLEFQMDQLCVQMEVSMVYTYHPLFEFFQNLSTFLLHENEISTKAGFSYY